MSRFVPFVFVLLGGCVSNFVGPDGATWHATDCKSISFCYSKAGDTCPKGYTIQDAHEFERTAALTVSPSQDAARVKQSSETTLVFKCK